ncbi:DinB family protein [Allokutzneria sp. NRRL B-24872]|uniref:DinB family protein n=1 Tax=Allokutzneria sp. NRRL B-24872 TaxID=1137961 RepID=UPI000A3C24CD|nr:DinB family protein [Allokutzneria sp. NRRL B-24872]
MANEVWGLDGVARSWPTELAEDELRLQWEFLGFLRATAVNKVVGVAPELAAATPWPTSPLMSLLGVVKHLTAVERFWMSRVGGGLDVPLLWDSEDECAEFRLSPADTPEAVLSAYQAEWVRSEEALAGLGPDDLALREVGGDRTVRWVLAHVVQETARHVGHLDVLREFADGLVGE